MIKRIIVQLVLLLGVAGRSTAAETYAEGTDLKQDSTANIRKVERGQRQYARWGLRIED